MVEVGRNHRQIKFKVGWHHQILGELLVIRKLFDFYQLISINSQIEPVFRAQSQVISFVFYSKYKIYRFFHYFFLIFQIATGFFPNSFSQL